MAASFQQVMDKGLTPVRDCTIAYIDNRQVFSPLWEQHIQHFRLAFSALEEVGLTANQKKSHLVSQSVQYQGFRIGQG